MTRMTSRRTLSAAGSAAALLLILAVPIGTARAGANPPVWGPAPLSPQAVPEIDPGSVLGAFTLLTSGLMVVTDRRRPK
jgi:hypothetical protein